MPLDASTTEKLITQFEFYFGDTNLAKDVYLKSLMAQNAEGFVPLVEFLKFKRVVSMTKDINEMVEALKGSSALVVDDKNLAIRRAAPMPESVDNDAKTVYVKPVPPTASLEELQAFFGQSGKVLAVWRRYFASGKDSEEKGVKPSCFVVFAEQEVADKFIASPPKYNEDQLVVKTKIAYLEEKAKEVSVKKAARVRPDTTKTQTPPMPRGAAYKIHGVGEIANFSEVKNLWSKTEQSGIRYVFTPSNEATLMIFQDEETGKKMVSELEKKATTLNGKLPKVDKIEGADEDELIKNVDAEITERAQKRAEQGGGRGRGGGGRGRGGRGFAGQKRNRD